MPIAAYFNPPGMTVKQYKETHKRLEAAGVGLTAQTGRLHHSCFGEDGHLMVFDVWESQEAFEAFGQKLMPILAEMGIEVGEPAIMPIEMIDQREIKGEV